MNTDTAMARAPWNRASPGTRITAVKTFLTAPGGSPLLIVRIETDDPGLVGYGCASTPQRPDAINTVLTEYLAPLAIGRDPLDISDLHTLASMSPYWRAGAIENSALAGIDTALWDLKGKMVGLPVHKLLGQVRASATVYGHADGRDAAEVSDNVLAFMEMGYDHVRCQVAIPGADTYGTRGSDEMAEKLLVREARWDPGKYVRAIPKLFASLRESVGWDVQLLHDVHERVNPTEAIQLARELDPFKLFFLEDALAPEDVGWLPRLREQSVTPLAIGEVFSSPSEFAPLISERLIDFARIRIAAIGGFTPAIKLATLCELYGVRTALHGPADVSPIGHAAAVALDVSSSAFGIQESVHFAPAVHDVFPGTLDVVEGKYVPNDAPGWGIDFDEAEAARYPIVRGYENWSLLRRLDGSVARP